MPFFNLVHLKFAVYSNSFSQVDLEMIIINFITRHKIVEEKVEQVVDQSTCKGITIFVCLNVLYITSIVAQLHWGQ
jgi:hypothetical protein